MVHFPLPCLITAGIFFCQEYPSLHTIFIHDWLVAVSHQQSGLISFRSPSELDKMRLTQEGTQPHFAKFIANSILGSSYPYSPCMYGIFMYIYRQNCAILWGECRWIYHTWSIWVSNKRWDLEIDRNQEDDSVFIHQARQKPECWILQDILGWCFSTQSRALKLLKMAIDIVCLCKLSHEQWTIVFFFPYLL